MAQPHTRLTLIFQSPKLVRVRAPLREEGSLTQAFLLDQVCHTSSHKVHTRFTQGPHTNYAATWSNTTSGSPGSLNLTRILGVSAFSGSFVQWVAPFFPPRPRS